MPDFNHYNNAISERIFILSIHEQKAKGNLKGNTSEEQYDYYEKKYLNNATYVKSLLQEYPELKRLLELKNNSIQRAECEIRKSLYAEKEQIQKIFCDGRKFSGTVGIYMSKGDTHRGGRSVAKVELDNGTILYYKPHSLDKNIKYQELYNYLCRKTGISCRTVQYLSHDSYGWEEKIENIPCKNESEVEHYYFRMGIHLFLGYALGATDLHGENIIAHGEYPVIIDMETYPGYLKQQSEKDGSSVEEKINKSTEIKLANSVIHTGMLPVLTWGRGNSRVLISAMGTEEKIKTPFKLPVVKDDKTSDIHIEYEPVEMQIKECIVRLNDQVINAADYTECIIRGFCRAYMVAMADKKVEVMLSGFFDGRSRVVLRHTQQYAMYLMASFHPDYMKSRECRKALLNVIHKEGESSFMKEIHDYEIESLLEMDIPCFEIDANSRSVYDGNGGEHKEYLPCTPYESWRMHMKQMSYSDMECQCDYIRLSMEMLKASDGKKKMFPTRIKGYDTDKERKIYSQIRKIVHRICSRAIIREQSVGWTGLQFWDNGHWNLRSGGIYLYDGISGTVLFLAKYLHDSLPNATYVGFTGTPIDATIDVFGSVVEKYTMTESVKDGITLNLVYEGRVAKVTLDKNKLEEIEAYYAKCEDDGANEHQIEESKKAIANLDIILGDPDRLKAVAKDFVEHYEKRVSEGGTVCGKAHGKHENQVPCP